MGSFTASLRSIGDREGLPATVNLDDGRLSIAAGDAAIGEWALDEVRLEPIPTGYRLAAEGEQILIEMPDVTGFESELSRGKVKKGKTKTRKATRYRVNKDGATKDRADKKPDAPKPERVMNQVDRGIAAAKTRWGSLLPEWVFTRMMFTIVIGALILTLLLPGLVSVLLLLGGALTVMLGAVVYSDGMLASKWLPGRTTPIHVLVFGVTILMFGVLLGVIAR